jgi:hypothetical protein
MLAVVAGAGASAGLAGTICGVAAATSAAVGGGTLAASGTGIAASIAASLLAQAGAVTVKTSAKAVPARKRSNGSPRIECSPMDRLWPAKVRMMDLLSTGCGV